MSRPSRVEGEAGSDLPGDGFSRLIGAWVALVVRRAPWVLLLAAAVTAASLYLAVGYLGIDTDTTNMIADDVPFRRHDTAFQKSFPALDGALVLVVDGREPEAAARDAGALAARLAASPHFETVYWPTGSDFLRRNGLLYRDAAALEELADRLAASAPLLGVLAEDPSLPGFLEIVARALHEGGAADRAELRHLAEGIAEVAEAAHRGSPAMLSWRRLVVDDERRAREIILARPRLERGGLSPAKAAMAAARAFAAEIGIGPERGTRLRLTGKPAMRQEELESARIGGMMAGLLSLGFVALLLSLGLRSPRLVVATLTTLLMGLSWSAGFAALTVGHLNLLSVAFAVLFIGMAVDFSIHFSLRFREEAARLDTDGEAAIRAAGRGVARGLAIAALAAGLGFFAFLPTDYRGFAELGLISGASMGFAYLANLTVLPALLALLPGWLEARLPPGRADGWLERLATRHRRLVWGATTLAVLLAALWLPRLGFDLNPVNLRDPDTESVATFLELSADPDASPYTVDVLVPDLETARVTAKRLGGLAPVRRSLTLASFVPAEQDEKLVIVEDMALYLAPLVTGAPGVAAPDDPRLPALAAAARDWPAHGVDDVALSAALARAGRALGAVAAGGEAAARDLEARLLAHFPRLLEDLSLALQAGPSRVESLPEDLKARWIGQDGAYRVSVAPAEDLMVRDNLARFVQAVSAEAPNAIGAAVIVSEASGVVIEAFVTATLLAVTVIALLLIAVHRNHRLVILTLLPLALAALFTLACATALGLKLNFANVIALPLLFGLGVASNIHVVERLRQLDDTTALMQTTTPRAVLFSTLTTLASFGSLAVSAHLGMASMGELLTLAILFTLICTLLILPSLVPLLGLARTGATTTE